MDLDPSPKGEISQLSGPGKSSQNPIVEAAHSEAEAEEDDSDDSH